MSLSSRFWRALAAVLMLLPPTVLTATTPVLANPSPAAIVYMPFNGTWASASSHPASHGPVTGDIQWAMDVYAQDANPQQAGFQNPDVQVNAAAVNGVLSMKVTAVSNNCGLATPTAGKRVRVEVKVDTTVVGSISYEHLDTSIAANTVVGNGAVLGKTKKWAYDEGCYEVQNDAGIHTHLSFRGNTCYVGHNTGASLNTGGAIGVLGTADNNERVQCGALPAAPGNTAYADGTYLQVSATGALYRVAGGAALAVSSLGNVPWSGVYQPVTQAVIDSLPQYPRDGTVIRDYSTGGIYVMAGGFPFAVTSLSNIPYTSWIDVDGWAIVHQLRSLPADGTVVRNHLTGGVYVVSGGGRLGVASMANIPSTPAFVDVDGWAISNQLTQYPANGSVIVDHLSGAVYVVAGGAALAVTSFNSIPPVASMARVDGWAISNELRQRPADGTVVRDYLTGAIYVVAGGAKLSIASLNNVPYTSWTNVDGYALGTQFLAYPADGTYVKGYVSGKTFLLQNGTATEVTSNPPSTAVVVDDWAIVTELGGTI